MEFDFGPQRISLHLFRIYDLTIWAPIIWRVLQSLNMPTSKSTVSKVISLVIIDPFLVTGFRSM